jgi:hypothetical protein
MTNLEIALIEMLGQDWAQHAAFEAGGEDALRAAFAVGARSAFLGAIRGETDETAKGIAAIFESTLERIH